MLIESLQIIPTVFVVIYSTFVCPTEIIAFSDRIEEFRAINTEVVGCSVDSVFTHLAWYVNPLHPNISMYILHYYSLDISKGSDKENLFNNQEFL